MPGPGQRSDYHQFFGVPVHFDRPDSRLAFNAAYLALPTIRSEQALKTFLRGAPGNLLVRYRHDTGWVAKTRAQLKALPAAEWPDFDTLAVRLGTTPATLRRRLRSEGQSFAAIRTSCAARWPSRCCAGMRSASRRSRPARLHRAERVSSRIPEMDGHGFGCVPAGRACGGGEPGVANG